MVIAQVSMAHPGQIRKLTYEDYCLYPDDGSRHEIIDGEHYMSPSPRTVHQRIIANLTRILGGHVRLHRLGELLPAPLDVLLSHVDIVQPDIVFVAAERTSAIVTDKNIQGSPDLLIEVISPGTQALDEQLKWRRYEKFGVAEYWLVYPDEKQLIIYRRAGAADGFAPGMRLGPGDTAGSPLLPDLELPVFDIFN